MRQKIFIMAEQKEGIIEEPSFSLLSEGKSLKETLGNSHGLSAIVMGHNVKALEELGQYGADRVYYFEDQQLERYQPELYVQLLTQFVREKDPFLFLLGATSLGSDLAPRIAARLKVGLVTQCVDILVDGDRMKAVKAISDQYLYQRIVFLGRGPKMLTMSPNAMVRRSPEINKRAEVITIFPEIDSGSNRIRFIEWIKADPKTLGLEEADRIICGGRGVGKGSFELIHQLADVLNGSVGATRPIIDWGILPYERQIGQTGIEVSPALLMTFGISGANEFTIGIEGSKLVIAVNADRKARIFKFADLGVTGDLHTIIPLIIEQIKRHKRNIEKEK